MKKTGKKSMAGGLLALSMILTGTGYAYWTDTLNVTTKATTGDLDVTFADLALYAQYDNEMKTDGWSIVDGIGDSGYAEDDYFLRGTNYNKIASEEGLANYEERANGYHNVAFSAELADADYIKQPVGDYVEGKVLGSDQINLEILKMYPGYAQAFRTDILNVGEIATKLSNLKFTVKAPEGVELNETTKSMLGIAMMIDKEQYHPNGETADVFKLCTEMAGEGDYFTVGEVDFLRLSALEKLSEEDVKTVIENAQILCSPDTDNRMDLFLGVAMDPDAEGVYTTGSTKLLSEELTGEEKDALDARDEKSQNKGAVVSIDFGWDQFNAGKDAANGNILEEQNVQNAQ